MFLEHPKCELQDESGPKPEESQIDPRPEVRAEGAKRGWVRRQKPMGQPPQTLAADLGAVFLGTAGRAAQTTILARFFAQVTRVCRALYLCLKDIESPRPFCAKLDYL